MPHLLQVQNTKGSALECIETGFLLGCTSQESLQTAKCSSINIEKGRNQGGHAGAFLPDVWLWHQASPEKALASGQWGLCPLTRGGSWPERAIKAASQFNIFCKSLHPAELSLPEKCIIVQKGCCSSSWLGAMWLSVPVWGESSDRLTAAHCLPPLLSLGHHGNFPTLS